MEKETMGQEPKYVVIPAESFDMDAFMKFMNERNGEKPIMGKDDVAFKDVDLETGKANGNTVIMSKVKKDEAGKEVPTMTPLKGTELKKMMDHEMFQKAVRDGSTYVVVQVPDVAKYVESAKGMVRDQADKIKGRAEAAEYKVKEIKGKAVEKVMDGIETVGMTTVLAAAMTVEATRKGKETVSNTVNKGVEISKETYDKARGKYAAFKKDMGDQFEKSKKSLFHTLTENMEYAKAKMRDFLERKTRPFIRAREAVKVAVKAGRQSWESSRPQAQLKPKAKESQAKTNERG